MNIERFVIEVNEQGTSQKLSTRNSDPLDVSKTQTRKNHMLLLSRKLRAEKYNKSVFALGCFKTSCLPFITIMLT